MKNKIKFIILITGIIIATIIICFVPSDHNLDNTKCEYNGVHEDPGQAYFKYKCEICRRKDSNSGSKSNRLCKECSKKYNRCIRCGKKVD